MGTSSTGCGCGGEEGAKRGLEGARAALSEVGARLGKAVVDSSGLGRRVLDEAVRTWRPVTDAWLAAMPRSLGLRRCCEVPETECPPRCVGHLAFRTHPGEAASGTVTVTNTASHAQEFHFVAQPFRGPSGLTGVVPVVTPAAASLAPGGSVTLAVRLEPEGGLAAGAEYRSELAVRGAWEQCVCLSLEIEPRVAPHCEVHQGPIPRRVRAHHWYDHFQCEELCAEPIRQAERPEKPVGTIDHGPA
jgi:hypothetical protein